MTDFTPNSPKPTLGLFRKPIYQSRFLGRGCDEELFSEKKGFSVKREEAIQWIRGLVRISTGKASQWRGPGDSVNCRTLKTEKLLSSSHSRKSALILSIFGVQGPSGRLLLLNPCKPRDPWRIEACHEKSPDGSLQCSKTPPSLSQQVRLSLSLSRASTLLGPT